MYKLEMVVANIKHQPWWWNGKPIYKFDDIDELIGFMIEHIPMTNRDIDFIYNNDENRKTEDWHAHLGTVLKRVNTR